MAQITLKKSSKNFAEFHAFNDKKQICAILFYYKPSPSHVILRGSGTVPQVILDNRKSLEIFAKAVLNVNIIEDLTELGSF